MFPRDR